MLKEIFGYKNCKIWRFLSGFCQSRVYYPKGRLQLKSLSHLIWNQASSKLKSGIKFLWTRLRYCDFLMKKQQLNWWWMSPMGETFGENIFPVIKFNLPSLINNLLLTVMIQLRKSWSTTYVLNHWRINAHPS